MLLEKYRNTLFDIIIVGAGPGGSICAKEAAEMGLKTLLIEREREVGVPVRCAEGIGINGLREFIDEDHWLLKRYRKKFKTRFVAPSGEYLDLHRESEGAIVDRKVFDFELARMAAENGAIVVNKATAIAIEKQEDKKSIGVEILVDKQKIKLYAKILIGADGIESNIGSWAGINTRPKKNDLHGCIQYNVYSDEIDNETLEFHFGRETCPGTYLWIFPKVDKTANVGLCVKAEYAKHKRAEEYLNDFMARRFNKYSILTTTTGAVIADKTLEYISTDNLMLVGDAAHQTNALTGGGIINAMKAGRIAAKVAYNAILKNDFSEKVLQEYDKLWKKKQGRVNSVFYNLKNFVETIEDELYNKTTSKLSKLPPEKITLLRVMREMVYSKPSLLLELPKLFTGI